MQIGNQTSSISQDRIELAKKCLHLIGQIAERGARSQSPANIGYVIQELSQVLLERTGTEDRVFEPVDADQLHDLSRLYGELDWVDGSLSDLMSHETPIGFETLPVGKEHMS
jgi:hypothetical protein